MQHQDEYDVEEWEAELKSAFGNGFLTGAITTVAIVVLLYLLR